MRDRRLALPLRLLSKLEVLVVVVVTIGFVCLQFNGWLLEEEDTL
jgi:hypothetical protein